MTIWGSVSFSEVLWVSAFWKLRKRVGCHEFGFLGKKRKWKRIDRTNLFGRFSFFEYHFYFEDFFFQEIRESKIYCWFILSTSGKHFENNLVCLEFLIFFRPKKWEMFLLAQDSIGPMKENKFGWWFLKA